MWISNLRIRTQMHQENLKLPKNCEACLDNLMLFNPLRRWKLNSFYQNTLFLQSFCNIADEWLVYFFTQEHSNFQPISIFVITSHFHPYSIVGVLPPTSLHPAFGLRSSVQCRFVSRSNHFSSILFIFWAALCKLECLLLLNSIKYIKWSAWMQHSSLNSSRVKWTSLHLLV